MAASLSEPKLESRAEDAPAAGAIGASLAAAIAVGTGLLLRAGKGYRPVPSIDDFIYIPHARASLDASLFGRDMVVQESVGHVALWPPLVHGLESTIGLSLGLWILTLVLSVATAVGMLRLIRGLGGSVLLLPLAAVTALAGHMNGLGRGTFDGAFGDAFHMQWLALTCLLFVYDAVVRQRFVAVGVLLGMTAICHPVVAAHGAVAVACSAAFWTGRRWRRLLLIGATALLVSSPVSIGILGGVLAKSSVGGASAQEVANLCYLFRLPHEFTIGYGRLLLYFLYVAIGLAGASALIEAADDKDERAGCGSMVGLMVGHIVLLAVAVLFHGEMFGRGWTLDTLLPFQLHLTRTTPLLLVLSATAATAAFEREVLAKREDDGQLRWGRLLFWFAAIGIWLLLLVVGTAWSPWLAGLIGLALATAFLHRRIGARPGLAGVWCLAAIAALIWHGETRDLNTSLAEEEQELYTWVRDKTASDALFVIPPGMMSFRYYGLRSIYVDFKFFPSAVPELLPEWRRRLERVAAPDSLALARAGFPVLPEWDRTYANRNTPRRIAVLLAETGADYFVWDREGLEHPPYVPVDRPEDPRVGVCFENDRFRVYRLRKVSL